MRQLNKRKQKLNVNENNIPLFVIRRRLRSHFKNSCFVFHRGLQTLENNKSLEILLNLWVRSNWPMLLRIPCQYRSLSLFFLDMGKANKKNLAYVIERQKIIISGTENARKVFDPAGNWFEPLHELVSG